MLTVDLTSTYSPLLNCILPHRNRSSIGWVIGVWIRSISQCGLVCWHSPMVWYWVLGESLVVPGTNYLGVYYYSRTTPFIVSSSYFVFFRLTFLRLYSTSYASNVRHRRSVFARRASNALGGRPCWHGIACPAEFGCRTFYRWMIITYGKHNAVRDRGVVIHSFIIFAVVMI